MCPHIPLSLGAVTLGIDPAVFSLPRSTQLSQPWAQEGSGEVPTSSFPPSWYQRRGFPVVESGPRGVSVTGSSPWQGAGRTTSLGGWREPCGSCLSGGQEGVGQAALGMGDWEVTVPAPESQVLPPKPPHWSAPAAALGCAGSAFLAAVALRSHLETGSFVDKVLIPSSVT